MHALTEIGLAGTSWMNAQFNTLQHRILKVAGKVCELNTIVRFHLPSSFPLKRLYGTILCNLAKAFHSPTSSSMLHPFLIIPANDQGIRLCFPHRKRGQRDAAHLLGQCTDSKEVRQRWRYFRKLWIVSSPYSG